jgi:subtilisin family serine protease
MHKASRRWLWGCVVGPLLVWLGCSADARAIVSSNADSSSIFNGVNINQLIGAETFYQNGYWGTSAVIANVEAGYVWNGHDTLSQVSSYVCDSSVTGQYDFHATMVGQVLVGQLPQLSVNYGSFTITYNAPDTYWFQGTFSDGTAVNCSAFTGIAPSASLISAAIATSWNYGSEEYSGSFNVSNQSLLYAYKTVMQTGTTVNGVTCTADVINSSWGDSSSHTGSDSSTLVIDALAYATHKTVVLAAGNSGEESDPAVGEPAAGYNGISVASLSSDTSTPVYSSASSFSSRGPISFYNPKTGETIVNARAGVSIAAPGDNLTLAAYCGLTGGHSSSYTDPTSGSGGYYFIDAGGTSFASPIVAGGAALLVDAGKSRFGTEASIDGRIIKAVLLNSADKTADWDNGQKLVAGVVSTKQALDYSVGAGIVNLSRAYTQYTSGTTDLAGLIGGNVQTTGWDFGEVTEGTPNDYYLTGKLESGKLAVTLDWFVDRQLVESTAEDGTTTTEGTDVKFANLDLEVWLAVNGIPTELVAESSTLYDNVEHLYFDILSEGYYMLRVEYTDNVYEMTDTADVAAYGLAWSVVPEPSTIVLLVSAAGCGAFLYWCRRKQAAAQCECDQPDEEADSLFYYS